MIAERRRSRRRSSGAARAARRGGIDAVLLRRLPGDSAVHRLWIGTKLIGLTALTIATGLNTGWAQLIALAALVAVVLVAARVPWRAWPRVPAWFVVGVAIGYVLSSFGAGAELYTRFTVFSLLFIMLSLVLFWTTELGDLAPALMQLGAPLRRVGMPIEQWALTTALAVRSLPLILDECRIVIAARRQRITGTDPDAMLDAIIDSIAAAMSAAVRRADDLGEVIALRGGTRIGTAQAPRPRRGDLVALALIAVVSIAPSLVS